MKMIFKYNPPDYEKEYMVIDVDLIGKEKPWEQDTPIKTNKEPKVDFAWEGAD